MGKYYGTTRITITLAVSELTPVQGATEQEAAQVVGSAVYNLLKRAESGQLYTRHENPYREAITQPTFLYEPVNYFAPSVVEVLSVDDDGGGEFDRANDVWEVVIPITFTTEGEFTIEVAADSAEHAESLARDEMPASLYDAEYGVGSGSWEPWVEDYELGNIRVERSK